MKLYHPLVHNLTLNVECTILVMPSFSLITTNAREEVARLPPSLWARPDPVSVHGGHLLLS